MLDKKLQPTYLKDYLPCDFDIHTLDLRFEIKENATQVHSVLTITRRAGATTKDLTLSGEQLKLQAIQLNAMPLESHQFIQTDSELIVLNVPDNFTLDIAVEIYPKKNTTLSGLYQSGELLCTQCEAQGFRRITYYLDRPDMLALFTTTLVADRTRFPILLSNGNQVEQGLLEDNRHWVKWQDPFKKPAYLFAVVAGCLSKVGQNFTTMSGREIQLEIYVEPGNEEKCEYALKALRHAMKWDENTYGLEYDLDRYMIVAVHDFNMGAMENKGLNIFNSKYILADEKTATDNDFQNIEAVVGHEYFHNWTGNRVTCRDWFQLSLKEGLTVFREQQFSADAGSPAVKRINDAKVIRTRQFAEDAGPMAHPVRPESYIEINNFYTATIYSKGAEVIRMLHTLLGKEKFRKGMDLYFKRHDGQAVTIEDFVAAFADANGMDLTQFKKWYSQVGTPIVSIQSHYDLVSKQLTVSFSQNSEVPLVIPIKIAVYEKQYGRTCTLVSDVGLLHTQEGDYVVLDQSEKKVTFTHIEAPCVISLLGDFSAPVKLHYPYSPEDLVTLIKYDKNPFSRWDSTQQLVLRTIESLMQDFQNGTVLMMPVFFKEAFQNLLEEKPIDPALFAQLITLPSFHYIAETLSLIEVDALNAARNCLLEGLAAGLTESFLKQYTMACKQDQGTLDNQSIGYRALKNICLYYLVRTGKAETIQLAQQQYEQAKNMTDRLGALSALNQLTSDVRQACLEDFYEKGQKDLLVVNKWLALHASCELPDTLEKIKILTSHPAFDLNNPNKVYALIYNFSYNALRFHDAKGEGYAFLGEKIIALNASNPQVAARLLESLTQWKRLDKKHADLMQAVLLSIQARPNLSEDVYEIVKKSLE